MKHIAGAYNLTYFFYKKSEGKTNHGTWTTSYITKEQNVTEEKIAVIN